MKVLLEWHGVGMLPVVRLYADGARDTLAGPSALANGEGSPEALMAHVRQQHGKITACLTFVGMTITILPRQA